MIRPGLEPGAFCVLDRCDNQLRHRTACSPPPLDRDENQQAYDETRYQTDASVSRLVKIHGIRKFQNRGRIEKGI